jgi:hypothetical protein
VEAGRAADVATAVSHAGRAGALARIVARLRLARGGMVQTPGQYAAAAAATVGEAEAWLERLQGGEDEGRGEGEEGGEGEPVLPLGWQGRLSTPE